MMAAVVVGAVAFQGCSDANVSKPRVYEGTTRFVDTDGIGVSLSSKRAPGQINLIVGNGVEWLGLDGSTRDSGTPECLPPLSTGARVAISTIRTEDRQVVVRVACKSLPTRLSWTGDRVVAFVDFVAFCQALQERAPHPAPRMEQDPCK